MRQIFENPICLDKPDYIIPLRAVDSPLDIYEFCRNHDISHFGYGFRFVRNSYLTEQLKFGYSAPEPNARSVQRGERLVRQIAWLPGWEQQVHSSHGYEFWHGCQELIKQDILPEDMNYSDIEIAVWSADIRNNISGYFLSRKDIAEYIESDLCEQHQERFGRLPYLNIADPTRNKTYRSISKTTFLDMFDIN